jgi:hypothetical protein
MKHNAEEMIWLFWLIVLQWNVRNCVVGVWKVASWFGGAAVQMVMIT